jgi:anti-sigma B factor antagonist
VREHRAGQIITLTVEGELDVLTAPRLVAQVDQLLRAEPGDVVLDLEETLFIDSAGLAMILNLQRRLRHRGHRLRVVCDEGPVRRVIEMARLEDTLGLVPIPT